MKEEFLRVSSQDATHRLILLHGWGANANDLLPLGEQLLELTNQKMELISLNAPHTHPEGIGRQWYALFPPNWDEVPEAIKGLQDRFKDFSSSKIPLKKTFLLGFSQGGAMTLASGCNFPFAGLIACSPYPHPGWKPTLNCPPILLIHGEQEPVVPIEASIIISELFQENKLKFDFHSFKGGHEIPDQALSQMGFFINRCIGLDESI